MNGKNRKMELLGSAPIPQALMALGIPIMIGMLVNALYNLVDAYFVGGLGESPMGGDFHRVPVRTGSRGIRADVWQRCGILSFKIIRAGRQGYCKQGGEHSIV